MLKILFSALFHEALFSVYKLKIKGWNFNNKKTALHFGIKDNERAS